jgi:hypothetical protein
MGFLLSRRTVAAVGFTVSVSLVSSLRAQAVIRGILYDDATRTPVRGTVMLVDPSSNMPVVHVVSDSLGRFELSYAGGTYQLAAVRDGYTSLLSAPIPLVSGERLTVKLPLSHDGDPQHNIGVTEHVRPDPAFVRAQTEARAVGGSGFAGRRAVGNGLQYGREKLEASGTSTLGEFLQNVPGFRVVDPQSTNSMAMSRSASVPSLSSTPGGTCHVGWFVDGHRMDLPGRLDPITDGLGLIQLQTIEAVEIFRGLAEMPPEFAEPDLKCGAVAIWMRLR